jgi:tRNA(fMet)-specific endonuclease VapC
MTLCLDTGVVIEIFRKRRPQFRDHLNEAVRAGEALWISSVVLHELSYGAMISARPDRQMSLLDAFLERVQIEPWTPEDAVAAARVRADLRVLGASIATVDSLIAGQALNRGWNVVTSNTKDFIRVPGLTVVDWSDPAGPRRFDQTTAIAEAMRRFKEDK